MKTSMLRSVSLLALASAALSAHATLLDFEDLTGVDNITVYYYGQSVTTQGYALSAPGAFSFNGLYSYQPFVSSLGALYTGSVALYSQSDASVVTLTRSGGGLFDLQSIDLANLGQQASRTNASTASFVGTRADGTTVSQTFHLQPSDAVQTFAFTGFTGLTSVAFGSGYQFDNVVLSPTATSAVPGPVAALPFALMALRRRKRA